MDATANDVPKTFTVKGWVGNGSLGGELANGVGDNIISYKSVDKRCSTESGIQICLEVFFTK